MLRLGWACVRAVAMKGTALVFLGPVCVRVAFRPCGGRVWPPAAETPCYASVANRAGVEGQNRQAIEATSKARAFGADSSPEGLSTTDRVVPVGPDVGSGARRRGEGISVGSRVLGPRGSRRRGVERLGAEEIWVRL